MLEDIVVDDLHSICGHGGQPHQTGLKVEPGNVRLVPQVKDLYEWRYSFNKAYLFRKHLHEHGVDACQDLIRDVGYSFGRPYIAAVSRYS